VGVVELSLQGWIPELIADDPMGFGVKTGSHCVMIRKGNAGKARQHVLWRYPVRNKHVEGGSEPSI
jgi:hypothetical protein